MYTMCKTTAKCTVLNALKMKSISKVFFKTMYEYSTAKIVCGNYPTSSARMPC